MRGHWLGTACARSLPDMNKAGPLAPDPTWGILRFNQMFLTQDRAGATSESGWWPGRPTAHDGALKGAVPYRGLVYLVRKWLDGACL